MTIQKSRTIGHIYGKIKIKIKINSYLIPFIKWNIYVSAH